MRDSGQRCNVYGVIELLRVQLGSKYLRLTNDERPVFERATNFYAVRISLDMKQCSY
jgi:hypothetical protein